MTLIADRVPAQALRGRGLGAAVGTLIGGGWLFFALRRLPIAAQILLGASGVVIVLWLLVRSSRLVVAARSLPSLDTVARTANRRVWMWFLLNFVVEIVLLNVAVALLAPPALHVYWLPAISLVVGLHFLPMAIFFAAPSYWACGGGMAAVAVVTGAAIYRDLSQAQSLVVAEALCNALILWATAAWGVRTTRLP